MHLVIITLLLLGFIVSGFFGRKVGVSGAQFITRFSVREKLRLGGFSFWKSLILFLMRLFIVGLCGVLVKTVFQCWHNGDLSIEGFIFYFQSFDNILLSIGVFTSGIVNKILDKSFLSLNFKDLINIIRRLINLKNTFTGDFFKSTLELGNNDIPYKSPSKPIDKFNNTLLTLADSNISGSGSSSKGSSGMESSGKGNSSTADSGSSGARTSLGKPNFDAIDKLLETQNKMAGDLLEYINSSKESKNSKDISINDKMDHMAKLLDEVGRFRSDFIKNYLEIKGDNTTLLKFAKEVRELKNGVSEIEKKIDNLPKDGKIETLKKEFDLTNQIVNKSEKKFGPFLNEIVSDLKNCNRELSKKELNQYLAKLDNLKSEPNKVRKEIAKMLHNKKDS